ncbi:E3 ubiquitin-protein ligase arih1-like [Pollicipes pollicipes]|uniref:E3 ubiquitin-protein ligase arih1-like n=1 Tax=Pollicipes pollicipes TaxID=41117 RepID=UPI00188562FD|nr:E3 ubiquitin-protein ligase arih1-like [Pollicipes pollicipes]XP_037083296.1 E3 ubiquitin-protein ligase arih1-like [Pollicipes pollicipes]XP_037083297.1 E3 ubiquitin-protein ligase arih1-like [Pollicipes pollicipes]
MDSDGEIQYDEDSGEDNMLYEADSGNESSGDELDFDEQRAGPSASRADDAIMDDYPFQVLSIQEIVEFMVEEINEVKDVAQLPRTTIRILLNHFNWDKEKLLERLYDTDQERLFQEAHVVSPLIRKSSHAPKVNSRRGAVTTEECEICLTVQPSAVMSSLPCGHRFCAGCWAEYLTTKVMDEGMGQTISCAAHGCDILVDDETVMRLVSEPRVLQRYQHLITNSFVECNRCLCWCPTPDCGYALKVSYPDMRPVTCKCGHRFCFACGEAWHDPVRCSLIKRWLKKCDDDSETFNWISANTKECPKCSVTIEKDGGCNHMVCKNQSCRADFCWVCLGSWEPHGSSWYSCNRYDEDEAKAARDAQEKSRAVLNRYLFYCNRYMNHMQSLKFENKLYASVKEKMEEMQQHNMSWIEVQFLKKAVDILCSCRVTLMYTYVFAYYLRKNNQSTIFEENQKDLERCTEVLSEYLERDITQENLVDIKQKVQDKDRYCDGRRRALLEHVHEGYERDWWVYND